MRSKYRVKKLFVEGLKWQFTSGFVDSCYTTTWPVTEYSSPTSHVEAFHIIE